MEKKELFKNKVKAFLHDPPSKPLILGLGNTSHEDVSKEYVQVLLGADEPFERDFWKMADNVASAADRTSFPLDYEVAKFRVDFRKSPVITHPTSGAKFDLADFRNIDAENIHQSLMLAFSEIREKAEGDPEKIFLYLWRSLPDFVEKHEQGNHAIGKLWDYLPADTRIPDHSVLDHSRMVSAFATAGINKDTNDASLMLFSIGPVQEFIAAAKRTNDLWAGSYMLSWLSWQAMKVFCNELGPDVILFPDLKGQPMVDYWLKYEKGLEEIEIDLKGVAAPTLPNRFMAVVPKHLVEDLGKKAEAAVHKALVEASEYAYGKVKMIFPSPPDHKAWKDQVSCFMECYWSAIDLPDWNPKGDEKWDLNQKFLDHYTECFEAGGDKANCRSSILNAYAKGGFKPNIGTLYGRFYELLDRSLGARKSVRNFGQLKEAGYRCTLMPNLAATLPSGGDLSTKKFGDYWSAFHNNVQSNGLRNRFGTNERLSPVAMTKRLAEDYLRNVGFPQGRFDPTMISTHSLAVSDFRYKILEQFENKEKRQTIEKEVGTFVNDALDLCELVGLATDTERPLPKLYHKAKSMDGNLSFALVNFVKLPGELFQFDYLDGGFAAEFEKKGQSYSLSDVQTQAKKVKNALLALMKASKIQAPSKYYAILYLDGDHMGQWLSGDKAPQFHSVIHPNAVKLLVDGIEDEEKRNHELYKGWAEIFVTENGTVSKDEEGNPISMKRPQAPTQHMAISRALNNYSLNIVKDIVEREFLGQLIYAGGDDVLAMVSLTDALPCALKLRAAFSGHLEKSEDKPIEELDIKLGDAASSNGFLVYRKNKKKLISSTLGNEATASVGVSIAHYMYPLKQALMQARGAEKFAKDALNRDAFSIRVVKRSGEIFTSGSKWLYETDNTRNLVTENLQAISDAFRSNQISPKFVVELHDAMHVLEVLPQEAVLAEVSRIFLRHTEEFDGEDKHKKEFLKKHLFPLFVNAHALSGNVDNQPIPTRSSIENVVRLLDATLYIAKGGGR